MEREQTVLKLLKELKGLEPLKQLFWSELNYERVNQPLSRREWGEAAKAALVEDPILFAAGGQNGDFHIIYGRLASNQLLLGLERPAVSRLLKDHPYALFVLSNENQDYWHFINVKYDEEQEKRRLFRRITIGREERLRTAAERLSLINLDIISPNLFELSPLTIQERHDDAFDVEAVTKQFYNDYETAFRILENDLTRQTKDRMWAHDYSLQFLNRCMFLYFIQRKGWLGNNRDFLSSFWETYKHGSQPIDSFVNKWLKVLFFEAFNDKFHGGHRYFPTEINEILALSPYLNGGLFTENDLDNKPAALVTDKRFEQIFKFLERYNFTIAEDSPLDKEVAVDPEMIGKVYESLVNVSEEVDERGEAGIFFTPRTEIDLMCRLSLIDYLANHLGDERKNLLYQLIFSLEPEEKMEADKAVSKTVLWGPVYKLLQEISVLDPACGSGSFLVGMLNILDDLQQRATQHLGVEEGAYKRKKRIIGQSLYGVDVMEWACHVAELRLWLTLIVDADFTREELHVRQEPLLPHFSFNIRCGDSLVQEIGGINFGHHRSSLKITSSLQSRITKLKTEKRKFYNNDNSCQFSSPSELKHEERRLFLDILDARYHDVQENIKTLRRKIEGPQERQIKLDGTVISRSHQMDLDAKQYQEEVHALTTELERIELSRNALSNSIEVPFVWDISFIEIFESDKAGFDIVIGNPPYVRQEAIAAPFVCGMQLTDDKKAYKSKLAHSVYQAFPQFFGYKTNRSEVSHKLDAKSDLYIYFYFHSLSLLNDKGSFCFITSNSWLDVGYGKDLQELLLKHCHVKMILDNQLKRTFANADINSIIALFSASNDKNEWALEKISRFVMFKVPFEHILSPIIFDEIEETTTRKLTKEYRVFPIQQEKLLEDGCEIPDRETKTGRTSGPLIKVTPYVGNKWGGKYLRAPEIFLKTLERLAGNTVPFDSVIHKDYGIKPGCVEFFYVDQKTKVEFEIEERFLVPIINSSRSIDSIYFGPNSNLFYCHEPKDLLGKGTLEYIKWGEGKGFHKLPSTIAHRPFWYSVTGQPVDFLLLQFWDKRFWTPIAETKSIMCSNNFFYGRCLQKRDNLLLQMNSSWHFMQIELFGRANQGQGVLTTYGTDYEYFRFVLPSKFTNEEIALGQTALKAISQRSILPIWDELKLSDRKALDDVVFNAIGLGKSEREEFHFELNQLVLKRIERASSLG